MRGAPEDVNGMEEWLYFTFKTKSDERTLRYGVRFPVDSQLYDFLHKESKQAQDIFCQTNTVLIQYFDYGLFITGHFVQIRRAFDELVTSRVLPRTSFTDRAFTTLDYLSMYGFNEFKRGVVINANTSTAMAIPTQRPLEDEEFMTPPLKRTRLSEFEDITGAVEPTTQTAAQPAAQQTAQPQQIPWPQQMQGPQHQYPGQQQNEGQEQQPLQQQHPGAQQQPGSQLPPWLQ